MAIATTATKNTSTRMLDTGALYRLLTWFSPAYPIGAFSYSHGLEYAVEREIVHDCASLTAWVGSVIEAGAGSSDALLLAAAWRASDQRDMTALMVTAELAAAWRGTAEAALESDAQGRAFLATTRDVWPDPLLDELASKDRDVALALAVGAATAVHGIPLPAALFAYLHGFAGNLVSAGVRLIPLGQSDGQRALAELEAPVARAADRALDGAIDQAGTAAPLIDWCSMRHETQYTRLFRS
jgi:urease accessory protein